MARPLRIEFPGAVYHITVRGNEKKAIFKKERDYEFFLETLSLIVDRFGWLCHAYCLMDNHFHLLIETPKANLSKGMKQLNGIYTQKFNRNYKRVGHLFQGRFKAILVEKESYLLALCRYIVLNPVKAGFVRTPDEWLWSSYRATVGMSETPGFLCSDWILAQFGETKKKAINTYKDYVLSHPEAEFPGDEVVGQLFLGSERYLNSINTILNEKPLLNLQEVPREQKLSLTKGLDELFQRAMVGGLPRNIAICKVYYENDYSMKEIADYFKLHYATVSRIIKKTETKLRKS